MIDEQTFPGEAASVAEARRFVARTLRDYDSETVELATLLASELATNCVRYANGDFNICISCEGDGIRLEVSDSGARRPEVRSPQPSDPRGRGLRIVDELARSWGVTDHTDNPGKVVWFTLEGALLSPSRSQAH